MTGLLWQLGGGAIAGVAVGYAFKKATKLALFGVGIGIILLYLLMKAGYITVRWNAVEDGLESGSRAVGTWVWAMTRELSVSLAGFGAGFLVGLKIK